MTGRTILFCTMSVLFSGCVSVKDDGAKKGPPVPLHIQRQQRAGTYGLKLFPGVGWKYIPPGTDAKILEFSPTELIEHARKKMKEGDLDEALFAARLYLSKEDGDFGAEAQKMVATVYEKRGLEEYAFEEYQKLLDQYPKFEEKEEVMKRMYEITDRFLEGKWFRWKLPYQESVYIPTGPSMHRTSGMFSQVVTNAPYGTYAALSQYGIGQAHENRLKGFWGFFADENEYQKAARAYQLLADRYSPRAGDAPRANQDKLDEIVATARFRMAKLYEIQANEGIYDQSMANRAIDAYKDFRLLHEKDVRRDEAAERIKAMRMERARGLMAVAEFYEKRAKWVAAEKYYGKVSAALSQANVEDDDNLLTDPVHQAQAGKWDRLIRRKISTELVLMRIHQAITAHRLGQQAEAGRDFRMAKRQYRVTDLNLHSLPETDMQNLVDKKDLAAATMAQAVKLKVAVKKDIARIARAVNQRALNP